MFPTLHVWVPFFPFDFQSITFKAILIEGIPSRLGRNLKSNMSRWHLLILLFKFLTHRLLGIVHSKSFIFAFTISSLIQNLNSLGSRPEMRKELPNKLLSFLFQLKMEWIIQKHITPESIIKTRCMRNNINVIGWFWTATETQFNNDTYIFTIYQTKYICLL